MCVISKFVYTIFNDCNSFILNLKRFVCYFVFIVQTVEIPYLKKHVSRTQIPA